MSLFFVSVLFVRTSQRLINDTTSSPYVFLAFLTRAIAWRSAGLNLGAETEGLVFRGGGFFFRLQPTESRRKQPNKEMNMERCMCADPKNKILTSIVKESALTGVSIIATLRNRSSCVLEKSPFPVAPSDPQR